MKWKQRQRHGDETIWLIENLFGNMEVLDVIGIRAKVELSLPVTIITEKSLRDQLRRWSWHFITLLVVYFCLFWSGQSKTQNSSKKNIVRIPEPMQAIDTRGLKVIPPPVITWACYQSPRAGKAPAVSGCTSNVTNHGSCMVPCTGTKHRSGTAVPLVSCRFLLYAYACARWWTDSPLPRILHIRIIIHYLLLSQGSRGKGNPKVYCLPMGWWGLRPILDLEKSAFSRGLPI